MQVTPHKRQRSVGGEKKYKHKPKNMKQSLLTIIAVLVAITLAMFSIDTAGYQYSSRSYRTYSYHPDPDTRSGDGDETPSLLRMDNTDNSSLPMVETITNESFPPLMISNSPLGTPPAMLETSAMAELTPSQLPPLDAGMVNVTGGFDEDMQTAGYRVNPMPGEFAIAVPYDPELLPQGFTEDDIQTYVYDRQYHRWVAIQRDSVNEAELLVYSRFRPWEKGLPHTQNDLVNPQDALTQVQDMMSFAPPGGGGDSPLDFINAVLKTPEMPETSAYTPTSIKELKAADPLEGITLIQPPTANNSGTANLSYPIEIPAGRQGMQPNLTLTYSSSGGNGWLGVGWDISIPSITVETRWGVPRYDQDLESEVYVYEGEQLVTMDAGGHFREMPHRTNQWTSRSALGSVERFYPRKNEAYDSIVRHGSGPDNYWWTVTHKNGVTDYYGKYASDNGVNNSCVLRQTKNEAVNNKGPIAHWALAESVDPDGNSVRYYYKIAYSRGTSNGSWGKQIYADNVSYTCRSTQNQIQDENGEYKVTFHRDGSTRTDVVTSLNRGFKEVTADVLCHLDVHFRDTLLRQYFFVTRNDSSTQYKTVLTDIVRIDSPLVDINCASVLDSNDQVWGLLYGGDEFKTYATRNHLDYFEYPSASNLFSNEITVSNLPNDGLTLKGVQNTFRSSALGATKTKSWNLGGTGAAGLGPDVGTTLVTLGANTVYSNSQSEGLMTLVDLDGDGLADKVFKKNGKLYFRKRVFSPDVPFAFESSFHPIGGGVTDFLKESSDNLSLGLQASCVANLSVGFPFGWSTTTDYMADINGDGLVDLVSERGAFFGKHTQGQAPSFSRVNAIQTTVPGSDSPEQSFISSDSLGTGTCGGTIFDGEVDTNIMCVPYPIEWVVPVSDTIPSFCLINGCASQIIGYKYADQTQDVYDTSQYHTTKRTPPINTPISVDSMIVRTFCFQEMGDCQPKSVSPDLDAVRIWVAPFGGTVNVYSSVRLEPGDTALLHQSRLFDGVRCCVEHNQGCNAYSDYTLHVNQSDPIRVYGLGRQDTTVLDTFSLDVNTDDILLFRLNSNKYRSFDRVKWTVTIEYPDSAGRELDVYNRDKTVYRSDSDFVLVGKDMFQATVGGNVWISGRLEYRDIGEPAQLVIGRRGTPEYSFSLNPGEEEDTLLHIGPFHVSALDTVTVAFERVGTDNPHWPRIHFAPLLKFFPSDTLDIKDTVYCYPQIRMDIRHNDDSSVFRQTCRKFFGELYRGWGQFAYNNHDSTEVRSNCVDLASLRLPKILTYSSLSQITYEDTAMYHSDSLVDTTDLENSLAAAVESSLYTPISDVSRWVGMTAYSNQGCYRSAGLDAAVSASLMDNREPTVSIPVCDSVPGSLSYEGSSVELQDIPIYDNPVPVSVEGAPVHTIRKRHRNWSVDFSVGVDLVLASFGISGSSGNAYIQSDYMDLNGDRYPDPMSTGGVQYSMPWGGIGRLSPLILPEVDHLSATVSNADGTAGGRCYPVSNKAASNNPKSAKMTLSGSGTLSHSEVKSTDRTDYMFLDVNGDGLPDMVNTSDMMVCLNSGYGFLHPESWKIGFVRNGCSSNQSDNSGLSGGWENPDLPANSFSLAQVSISGGTGRGTSYNSTTKQMVDINGDGLPDKVQTTNNNSGISVQYNLGNGQWSQEEHIGGIRISESRSASEDVNLGVTVGFTACAVLKITVGIQTSPYNRSLTTDVAQLVDIDGDGYPDYITSESETSATIRLNTAGKTNLLRKVTNFNGSTIEMDYELSVPSYEKPHRSWNLARVETRNNVSTCPVGGNRTLATFSYGRPHYDRYERMEFGYDTVKTVVHNTDSVDAPYRRNFTVYNNVNLAKRGRKVSETVQDGSGARYVVRNYKTMLYDFLGDTVDEANCRVEGTYVGHEAETTIYYEGQNDDSIVVAVSKEYDRYRNIIRYTYEGIRGNGNGQHFSASISYKQNAGHNLVSLPETVVVYNHDSSTVFQSRTAEYDANGHLTRLTRHNGGQDAVWDFHYDPYGNMVRAVLPQNAAGERTDYRYTYDPDVHTYPVRVENYSLGFASTAEYDLKFGKPVRTTDINGNVMRYGYDGMGRMVAVTAPYETDSLYPYTIRMEYHPHNFSTTSIFTNQNNPYSYAVTRHIDPHHPHNDILTTVISDGWGRILQTKKDAEINGQEVSLVTGKVVYDCFGRTVKQYHPFTEDTIYRPLYNPQCDPSTVTETGYDILDRPVFSIQPYGHTTTIDYGFGSDGIRRLFRTTETDPMGNVVTVLKDGLGQLVRTVAPMNTVTRFEYNPIGQLAATTDPDGFTTTYGYDMLGRMTHRTHPDAGTDRYTYDPSGNATSHVNGNGDSVIYAYHYNLLTSVSYPRYPANNVRYWYGAPGAPDNCVGKVALMADGSGLHAFKYGKLGEVIENIRTFVLPNESHPYTFKMKFCYDSWNRIQSMTYPDGEVVTYTYDRGGMLQSVQGRKGMNHLTYVENTTYNAYGLKESVLYGNGSYTEYQYDLLMRLSHLYSENGQGEAMQDMEYEYDNVNNITDIYNNAPMLLNGLGGDYWSHYEYDDLYRLSHAKGNWNGGQLNYLLDMEYHSNGRIEYKKLYAEVMDHTGATSVTNYANGYLYNVGQPNTLEYVVDDFSGWQQIFTWDAAGNMTNHENFAEGCARHLCWDEENRLVSFADCENAGFYQYDANGERTYKLTGGIAMQNIQGHWRSYNLLDNPTLYTSPYLVATPKGYTKHYYAESERVASMIGSGGLGDITRTIVNMEDLLTDFWVGEDGLRWEEVWIPEFYEAKHEEFRNHLTDVMMCAGADPLVEENRLDELRFYWQYIQEEEETDCYWYHPDHLGSSSWITFSDGEAIQHLHYLPWGENFVDQRSSTFDGARFTFSAKEKDAETGYSYFGSRYYNSDLSIWLSVDPMSDKYPSLSPYVYCANNPIKLVDPNGEEVEYNSFVDRVIVGLLKIFDVDFRKQFKELKNSEETYVFNKNAAGINELSTDGKKVYINYSMNDGGKSKEAGQTIFSNLRHETTHAVQFEYGELGFSYRGAGYGIIDRDGNYFELKKWLPMAHDITDEYEAHNFQNSGFVLNNGKNNFRNYWNHSSSEDRFRCLTSTNEYSQLPETPLNSPSNSKIKTDKMFIMPHRQRISPYSYYGKSYDMVDAIGIASRYQYPSHSYSEPPQVIYIKNRDTIFCYKYYISDKGILDSVKLDHYYVNIGKRKWIRKFSTGEYWICKFKACCSSPLFKSYNAILFNAEKEVKIQSIYRYSMDGVLTEFLINFGVFSYSKCKHPQYYQPEKPIRDEQ